ncbi:hypothetical protein BH11ACT8_BH11ACT8_23090 [soil metagenome]
MESGHSGDASGTDDDQAWRPPAPARRPVEELSGYTDLVEVGRGGDSVVYRARQESVQRDVAIKVLDVDDPHRVARFAREIEITVQLGRQHPNIVTVLAAGTTASGRPAIVMDFFDGGTLHDRLRAHGPLSVEEVGRIGAVLADALSFAHERGVLHRDVKPQNVLVLPTSWVLTDFGIARLAGSEHTSSAETFTYRHAAPQILDGHPPTAGDDIWSLGSTLFTLLDGRPPFASEDPDDDSALSYLRRARTEEHRALEVPGTERIAPIIDRCLSKDVTRRWVSAAELRDAFLALRTSAWDPESGDRVVDAGPAPEPTPTPVAASPVSAAPIPSRPETLEPSPVALSALSHAVRAVDVEPTGTGLPDATGPDPRGAVGSVDVAGPATDEAVRSRRRRLPLVLGVTALVVGLSLGVVGAALRGGDDPTGTSASLPQQTSTDAIPTLSSSPTDVTDFNAKPDPRLKPVLATFTYDGVNLRLAWTDPTDGEGVFSLHRIEKQKVDGTKKPVLTDVVVEDFSAGQLSDELTVSLPLGYYCYYLVVQKIGGDFGISDRRCFTNTP